MVSLGLGLGLCDRADDVLPPRTAIARRAVIIAQRECGGGRCAGGAVHGLEAALDNGAPAAVLRGGVPPASTGESGQGAGKAADPGDADERVCGGAVNQADVHECSIANALIEADDDYARKRTAPTGITYADHLGI